MRVLVVVAIILAILAIPLLVWRLPRRRRERRGRVEPSADTMQTGGAAPPRVPNEQEAPPGSRPDRERHGKP